MVSKKHEETGQTSDNNAGWAQVGEPVCLSDAGFLEETLVREGIESRICSASEAGNRAKPLCSVLVRDENLGQALAIREDVLAEDEYSIESNMQLPLERKRKRFKLALLVGIVVMVIGMRVSLRMKSWRTLMMVLVLGVSTVIGVLVLQRQGEDQSDDNHPSDPESE